MGGCSERHVTTCLFGELVSELDGHEVTLCRTVFMALPSDDAFDVLDEDALARQRSGYSAVVWDDLHGTWVNVSTGDWIIKGVQGEFYPCRDDVFRETYEAVAS